MTAGSNGINHRIPQQWSPCQFKTARWSGSFLGCIKTPLDKELCINDIVNCTNFKAKIYIFSLLSTSF